MIKYRINRQRVEKEMFKLQLNFTELAEKMDISRQKLNYILNDGGKGYAQPLAKALKCKPYELIVRWKA